MIEGFKIGHHTADGDGWLTGTTVVLSEAGAVGGVDVRGGAPGTRETDLLHPAAMVEQVHAVVLTGGSAFGLASADGVMTALERRGIGFPIGNGLVVPIVPAAVILDLGRGGDPGHRPTAEFGAAAVAAAGTQRPESGCVGAGTGAVCGGLKGGFGYAERAMDERISVAAAVVVNAAGSPVDLRTGRLYGDLEAMLPEPTDLERQALAEASTSAGPPLNTTLGVVLTDATLTKAQASKVAAVAHDGLARAIRPVHSMVDGDAVFALASGRRALPATPAGFLLFNRLLAAAADVFAAACVDAVLGAESRGTWRSYAELAPSTGGRRPPA